MDGTLEIRTGGHWHPFLAEWKNTPRLNQAIVEQVRHRTRKHPEQRWIVLAPYITTKMGEELAGQGINYIDLQGNCDIRIPEQGFLVHVEGKRPQTRPATGRGMGAPGYRVLFALLAEKELAGATVRAIADAAEVGKTTAAETMDRLREEGFLLRRQGTEKLTRRKELTDRWVTGYADILRPRLILGTYRTRLDPFEFERRTEADPPTTPWAWGGAAAAVRMYRHYRGGTTLVHTPVQPTAALRRADALPARDGNVLVVAPPCPVGLEGRQEHLAHPLLIYAELLLERDERARETAELFRERFLEAEK